MEKDFTIVIFSTGSHFGKDRKHAKV